MSDRLWHAWPPEVVLRELRSTAQGLGQADAQSRLAHDGPNTMPRAHQSSALEILAGQLRSVVVALLGAAIAISVIVGDHLEAVAIGGVLLINAGVGFITERRARRAIESLADLEVRRAMVYRDGSLVDVEASEIVRGDVVELAGGRLVAADGRLLQAHDLSVDEAALTGESLPVTKSASVSLEQDTPLAERRTMVFKGTMAVAGLGRYVVTATGAATEVGRIGTLSANIRAERTPLERQLDRLGTRLVWLSIGVAAIVALLGLANGMPTALVLQTSIALAIAAVPEALPAVATIALAVGVHRMARRNALVRYLPAVESLGSATVICTDKTRTLTSGDMRVVRIWVQDRDYGPTRWNANEHVERVLHSAALATRPVAESGIERDPVDAAMWVAVKHTGTESPPPEQVIPFSSERGWMAGARRDGASFVIGMKGAPRAVLDRSTTYEGSHGRVVLDEAVRQHLLTANERLAQDGLRVLAVASGSVDRVEDATVNGLTFLGFVGLADPPAPGVPEAVAALARAGLRTLMLTGDQRGTALAIGRQLRVGGEAATAVDGRELDRIDSDALADVVRTHSVFSRVTPEHKLSIVRSLRAQGEIVAMLGDGINDAAALKQADVGVAMGQRGTDVAKQAATVVLQDDRFETIVAAVEEGRVIFDNIRKFVFYLFSCNAAEVLFLLVAGLANLPLPLLPLQLLWLNLLTDTLPALSLAMEPAEPNVMRRPPRSPRELILSSAFLLEVLGYAILLTGVALGAFIWARTRQDVDATTMAFLTLGIAQVFHLGNARRAGPVVERGHALANRYGIAAAALALLLLVAPLVLPRLGHVLHLEALPLAAWAVALALGMLPAFAGQLWKSLGRAH